uniref:SCO7613 C-terminal domain-containing membrane protein n=1 Tax=Nocardioides sp. TaxID=35761 RepID=UPI00286E7B75
AALVLLAGLASDWLTAAVLAVFTVAALTAELRGARAPVDLTLAGTFLAPLTGAGLIWTVAHLTDIDTAWRYLHQLQLLGVANVFRPVLEREVSASAASVLAVAGSVVSAGAIDQTWLAIYLTIAGVIATVSSLLNPERRHLAWLGLLLLTTAQWIRLQQIGVDTVEAYTLPLALVLLTAGSVALLRGHRSSISTLAPGLGLALVPTLLQVLVDPLGLRSVLLGLACVVLVAIGLARGWAAPLLAGAGVGALVVLRQATLAEVIPQWVLIGLVGVVLTVVGVTWEQRLKEIRTVSAYVRGLR